MPPIKRTLIVKKPLKNIYEFLNTPQKHTLFIPNMVEFRPTQGQTELSEGTEIIGLRVQLGSRMNIPYVITKNIPQKELAMRGKMGFIEFEDGYILSQEPNGDTRIDFWLEFPTSGWMNLIKPILWVFGVIHAAETLFNLERALKR